VVVAGVTLYLTPRTYEASARVFISASPSIPNSAQFVNQRAKSYPDVAESEAVLGPVIDSLGLDTTPAALRSRVSASNPVDTSQVTVVVSGRDPEESAAIANAVAEHLVTVVEDLEIPVSGTEPVRLTLTDSADAPTHPVAPVPTYVLGLGLLVGLFLGAAAAIARDRRDTALYTEKDVRTAWGEDVPLDVIARPHGQARRSILVGSPARALAHRLELAAEDHPVRVVLLPVATGQEQAAIHFAEQMAADLHGRGVSATVSAGYLPTDAAVSGDVPQVRLDIVGALAPLRHWRHVAAHYDGVVLMVIPGRADEAELKEVRRILARASLSPLAVVLAGAKRSRAWGTARSGVSPVRPSAAAGNGEPAPVHRRDGAQGTAAAPLGAGDGSRPGGAPAAWGTTVRP